MSIFRKQTTDDSKVVSYFVCYFQEAFIEQYEREMNLWLNELLNY
jgi:hypothetical protein